MKYSATFHVIVEVEFDDDGLHDLRDQAFDALWAAGVDQNEVDAMLVGSPQQVSA